MLARTIRRTGVFFADIYRDFMINLSKVEGNARYLCLSQLLWSVTYTWYTPLMTQYMKDIGLSNSQVGIINGVTMFLGMIVALFATWITDRMGRRYAFMLADVASWAVGCAVWALTNSFAGFLIAAVCQATIRINSVAWSCMLVEGVPPENRLSVFAVINLTGVAAAFCAPLANLLILPLGLVPAMRIILGGSSIMYITHFLWRHKRLVDTDISIARKEQTKGTSPLAGLKDYPMYFRIIGSNKLLLAMVIVKALYMVVINFRNVYLSITVVQGLHFDITMMSIINLVNGAVMLLCQLLIVPKLSRFDQRKGLMVGILIGLSSHILLIFAPANQIIFLMASVVGTGVFMVLAAMLIDTMFANAIEDKYRSGVLGVMGLISVGASAPFQYLGGVLADLPVIGSRMPMIIISTLLCVCLLAFLPVARKMGKNL